MQYYTMANRSDYRDFLAEPVTHTRTGQSGWCGVVTLDDYVYVLWNDGTCTRVSASELMFTNPAKPEP